MINRVIGKIGEMISNENQTSREYQKKRFLLKMDSLRKTNPSLFTSDTNNIFTPDHVKMFLKMEHDDFFLIGRNINPPSNYVRGYLFLNVTNEKNLSMVFIKYLDGINQVIEDHIPCIHSISFICELFDSEFKNSHVIRQISPYSMIFRSFLQVYIEESFQDATHVMEMLITRFNEDLRI